MGADPITGGIIAGLIISAIGTTYSATESQDASRKQKNELNRQKQQSEVTALKEREVVTSQAQMESEAARREAAIIIAEQNVANAVSGAQLSPGTSIAEIQELTKADFAKTFSQQETALEQTKGNIETGLANTQTALDFQKGQLPSTAGIVTSGALTLAGQATSAYAQNKQYEQNKNLLTAQYAGNKPASTGKFQTSVLENKYFQ